MEDLVGREIFVIVSEEDTTTEISFYGDIMEATERLVIINPVDEPDTKVFHGILSTAYSLPSNLKDESCYIIILGSIYTADSIQGVMYQCECDGDTDILAREIEELITNDAVHNNRMFTTDIEDIFILYGYEVGTGLCIDTESIDEEVISTCKTIAAEAKKMLEKHTSNQGE